MCQYAYVHCRAHTHTIFCAYYNMCRLLPLATIEPLTQILPVFVTMWILQLGGTTSSTAHLYHVFWKGKLIRPQQQKRNVHNNILMRQGKLYVENRYISETQISNWQVDCYIRTTSKLAKDGHLTRMHKHTVLHSTGAEQASEY